MKRMKDSNETYTWAADISARHEDVQTDLVAERGVERGAVVTERDIKNGAVVAHARRIRLLFNVVSQRQDLEILKLLRAMKYFYFYSSSRSGKVLYL